MITLTAQMRIQGENPLPFTLGVSELGGGSLFGETVDVEAVFDRRNLLSLESEIRDRSDIKLPSWGIFSNGGNLSFKDINSRFLGYANAGLLKSGIKVEIFLNDTISKRKEIVGTYYTADWEYDNDSRSVSVSLKDNLEKIQEKNISFFIKEKKSEFYGIDIYKELIEETKRNGIEFSENLPKDLEDILYRTKIKFPYLKKSSIWSLWEIFCEAFGCFLYLNENGLASITYDFGD